MFEASQPSYEQLAAQVVAQVIAEQAALIQAMRAKIAELKRRLDQDSTTLSQPPSKDTPAAKAKAKARARSATVAANRKRAQGGQPGHPGAGLARVADPDRVATVEPDGCT